MFKDGTDAGIRVIPMGKERKYLFDRFLLLVVIILVTTLVLPSKSLFAAGTPAGTEIPNQATISYVIDATNYIGESNTITTQVAELLNVNCVWQDSTNIAVSPGDMARVLTFRVTNTGNGTDEYALAFLSTIVGDNFDPLPVALYIDIDDNGAYDPIIDIQYQVGINDPLLPADDGITVFVLNDIPIDPSDGDLGYSELTATSNTVINANAARTPGIMIQGVGDGGTDAVIGSSSGSASSTGIYEVSSASISIIKSASIVDPSGGSEPLTGAVITYSLVVAVSGSGTALDSIMTDVIPVETSYNPGTLSLNGIPLTDMADIDAGDAGGTTPGTITVYLGDVLAGSPAQVIAFDVTIN